ncbi:uncharacterized protein [Anoplolepis gracilipes]|uniref:uncharacterized protein n=1 Tax=Anoplolepis gracilipes TaxID=354296 RepID=UPI003BA261E6
MTETNTRWCCAPGCMLNIKIAKRHFFRFPKERKRWLEWIKACNRMDLMTIGPDYANQYYRLCHLHFRVEMFRNIEGRIYLSKEAIPSIFLKPMQAGNNKSTDLIQPISFVTIFLKPESRTRNSTSNLSTQLSLTHPTKTERDTTVISPLQVLFPRASIKQVYEDKNIPKAEAQLVKEVCTDSVTPTSQISRECHGNIPKEEVHLVQFVKEICTDSTTPTSSRISSECDNGYVIDLTSVDSLEPTTSKVVSVHTTQENGDRILKRRRWHISTQTPEAWVYIDSFLKKRRIENLETHIDNQVAKRSKMLCVENEDHCTKVEQFKAACTDLLPRNYALLVSAFIDAREKRKTKRSFANRQSALEFFLIASGAYRLYRPLCLLPTVRQLWRHIRNWDIPPGLNDNVLNALHLKVKSLPPTERLCCLCVSEMRLKPYLFYNLSRDRIVGFHDIGVEKRRTLARKALVIMARSLTGDWEQPVAYYFYGSTCANIIKDLIFQAIIKLKSIGATVHALITGTAPTFLRLSRQLEISVEHSFFLVNGEKIFYIFDVPRLIRVTRNIFMSHELRFREKRASWTDIELLFRRDSQMRLPLVSKLSVGHLEPSRRQKTETKYAVQVFSSSMAAGLSAHIASGEFPLKAIGTVEFVHTFDQLFDILNSSVLPNCKTTTKDFSQAFTGSVHEMSFLQRTLDFLKSIRVIDANGVCVKSMKSFDRWQITINAVIQLWSTLKEHQILFLRTRKLNQEGIERVFCSIRRQSGNRVKPTPILFTRAFKNLVSKHLLEHSSADNSAANARRMFKRIALSTSSLQTDTVQPIVTQIALSVTVTNYRDIDLLPEKSAFKRVCEFLLDECLRVHVNCDVCIDYAAKENSFSKDTSNSFSLYVSGLEDTFMRNFEKFSIEDNLGAQMLQFAQQVEYKPLCPDFPVAFLIKLFLRMRIYFTLLRHNKICKNVESRNSLNVIQL